MKEILLNPISLIFKCISFLNLKIRSLKKIGFKDVYIISIDNLSFGGTGKTPAVLEIAKYLKERNIQFSVILRGYRSKLAKKGCLVSKKHTFSEVGDEALIYRSEFPEVDIFIGKDRVKSIKASIKKGNKVIILDDGFQSVNIEKDLRVMLVNPFHSYYYLRNFKFMVSQEDIILYFSDKGFKKKSRKPAYSISHLPGTGKYTFIIKGLFDRDGKEVNSKDLKIIGFSGIGDNKRFRKDLKKFRVKEFYSFRDHHKFTKKEVDRLNLIRIKKGYTHLVCTYKDFIRIDNKDTLDIPLIYLKNRIEFNVNLKDFIYKRIDEKKNKI